MKFSAWFSRSIHRKSPDSGNECHDIQPLLSLYSDKMTAPPESIRVEAHLTECGDCRRSLAWMQATNAALSHREPTPPPPDMSLRIRNAIAELDASKRPVRAPLVYRPAFAGAFAILIGAAVVSQITLRHYATSREASQGTKIAMQPHETAPPLVASPPPYWNLNPVSHPAHVARRVARAGAAAHLPSEIHSARSPKLNVHTATRLNSLPETPLAPSARKTTAHSPAVVRPNHAALIAQAPRKTDHERLIAQAPRNPIHREPVATNPHAGEIKVAVRPAPPPEATAPPAPITKEPSAAPITTRVAAAEIHASDALSGVRSHVIDMHAVSFNLSSGRAVRSSAPVRLTSVNAVRTAEYSASESLTAPLVRE